MTTEGGSGHTPAHLDAKMTESTWEHLALDELVELAWEKKAGKDLAPGTGHRRDWDDLILHDELQAAIEKLNPELTSTAVHEALRIATDPASREAYPENRQAHKYLTDGIRLTYTDEFGAEQTPTVRLIDFTDLTRTATSPSTRSLSGKPMAATVASTSSSTSTACPSPSSS